MAMPVRRLNTSRSESGTSVNSRLSNSRRERLVNLKRREDLKGALTEKFKSRFGRTAQQRADDEVTVASVDIRKEVDRFAAVADVTEANLGRLERRLQKRATSMGPPELEVMSTVSGVSAYSTMSGMPRSRSLASTGKKNISGGAGYDWSKLDEYASYLHEQDARRQKAGVAALQKKLRKDLDKQVAEKKAKLNEHDEEERRYHSNMMVELGRWKQTEQARAEEMQQKLMREKRDRDRQLAYGRHLKDEANELKKQEEAALVDKIVNEMEAEQQRFLRKKMETRKSMRKVFKENEADQRKRAQAAQAQKDKDAAAMKEYSRILDEQEEQRAEELAARMKRQKSLMDKLQANVAAQAKESCDNDALRTAKQREEMDRHYSEAERVKQQRLRQLRLENQAYLFKQMQEKDARKGQDKELEAIQSQIMERDTEEYNDIEREKMNNRKMRNFENRMELERQIEQRSRVRVPEMSEAEMKMNKDLLMLVDKTLQVRDERMMASKGYEGVEDY